MLDAMLSEEGISMHNHYLSSLICLEIGRRNLLYRRDRSIPALVVMLYISFSLSFFPFIYLSLYLYSASSCVCARTYILYIALLISLFSFSILVSQSFAHRPETTNAFSFFDSVILMHLFAVPSPVVVYNFV